jgi:hypothetical protein
MAARICATAAVGRYLPGRRACHVLGTAGHRDHAGDGGPRAVEQHPAVVVELPHHVHDTADQSVIAVHARQQHRVGLRLEDHVEQHSVLGRAVDRVNRVLMPTTSPDAEHFGQPPGVLGGRLGRHDDENSHRVPRQSDRRSNVSP